MKTQQLRSEGFIKMQDSWHQVMLVKFYYKNKTSSVHPWISCNSPTETSWAKASEMRRSGSPTTTQVTILSTASSVRTLRYRAWFGSFSRKSLNTYSVATCAMAMSPLWNDLNEIITNLFNSFLWAAFIWRILRSKQFWLSHIDQALCNQSLDLFWLF